MQKTAIVTGAAGLIGQGITKRLTEDGWQVAGLDLEPGEGIVRCDVSDETSVAAAFAELAPFLDTGLGLLVNNAGIAGAGSGPMEDLSLAEWNRRIGTNLTGPFLVSRAALPHLRRGGQGAIVNITSTRAFMSEPDTEAYAATKGGLTALTHAMAVSLGPAVRVSAIAPGWIAAPDAELTGIDHAQHPAGRVGTPHDVAEAVLYLARSGFATGGTLVLDGGMTKRMIYAE